jgi:uroporphyrinogen decarboxylase
LPVERTPIWFMRQAGRYMPEYRQIRERHNLLEIINTPELAAEVTLQPIHAFGFDAAIIFADILPPLIGMGLKLELAKGGGPVIHNPLSQPPDIDRLATPPAAETMPATLQAIQLVAAELAPHNIPLIGFAGAPFTLASYAIEGGSSKDYRKTKALMFGEPAAWKRLMNKLVTVQADYLIEQVKAGAAALQLFDSWVGLALSKDDYIRCVQPYNKTLLEMIRTTGAPVIHFSTGTQAYLGDVAACGGDVLGVDWRMPLSWAWQQIDYQRPLQGNLDPVALLAPWRELRVRAADILDQAAAAIARGAPGHIFNLGHGLLPQTPVETVKRLVNYVKESGD